MKKIFVAAILLIIAMTSFGCSKDPTQAQEINQQLDELSNIIEIQNEELNELNEVNEGLNAEISQLMSQLEEYEIEVFDAPLSGE